MSVLFDSGRYGPISRILLSAVFTIALVGLVTTGVLQGQEEASTLESPELWDSVIERYEVVVLSRSLLLEPLGDDVELRTIEVSDAGIAIDGVDLGNDEVVERLGAEDAALLYSLVEMDHESRMALFEETPSAAVVIPEGMEEVDEEAETRSTRHTKDTQVIVGQSHVIEVGEVVRDAVVFGGPLTIKGKVIGDATAIGGPVTVEGEVTGEVVAVGGSVTLEEGAEVLGGVVSVGGRVERAEGSRVAGEVVEVPFLPDLRFRGPGLIFGGDHGGEDIDRERMTPVHIATTFMWGGFRLLVVALFAAVVMLLARRPLERVGRRAAREAWKSGLVGLVSQILILPLLIMIVLILCISIIGIPLLLLVPFACLALALIAFLGYCAVCWNIGRFLENRFGWNLSSPYLELFVGIGVVQVWTILGNVLDVGWGPLWFFGAMLCLVGAMIQYAVWTIGFGAAVLTRFGSAEGWKSEGPAPPVASSPTAETVDQVAGEVVSPTDSAVDFEMRSDGEERDSPRQDSDV